MQRCIRLWLFLLIFVGPATAYGYNTDKDRQSDFSAFTLRRNQARIGLFQIEYGIFKEWTVGTYTLPWFLIPVTHQFNGSLYSKSRVFYHKGWALSFRSGVFYSRVRDANFGPLKDGDFDATVLPLTLTVSKVFNERWTLSFESSWIQMILNAGATTVDDANALGAGAQSNLQFALNGEYRVSKVLALNLVTRYLPYVTTALITSSAQLDSFTQAELSVNANLDDVRNAFLIQPGFTLSWKYFNFQLGLGYGNFFVPGLRIAAPARGFVPDLALYFRF
ncbi:MAG: hypothetical protein MK135_06780 [Polyangiaceae bacterium]|nr:hypothetical protein [Polyangiaceae bacterium]